MITLRSTSAVIASICVVTLSALSVRAQSADRQGELSNYEGQLAQCQVCLQNDMFNETSDQTLLRRLKGVHYSKERELLSARIDKERFLQMEYQTNIHNLEGWVLYEQGMAQKEVMNAEYQRHNADEAAIDQEVARRNAYSGPAVSSGNPLWGSSTPLSGGGYGGYSGYHGYGGHWHSSGGGTHWHSGGGGGGGHHSAGHR